MGKNSSTHQLPSGTAAAISAAMSGSRVIILEKCAKMGGTGMSVGSFTAANTAYQYRTGLNDSIVGIGARQRADNGASVKLAWLLLRQRLGRQGGLHSGLA